MRCLPQLGFTHPVLTPESDHYPNGEFNTYLEIINTQQDELRFKLTFDIRETTLEKLLAENKARCIAMLYCPDTLYQENLKAEKGTTIINGVIRNGNIRNNIELHPNLIAAEQIILDPVSAHPFYRNTKPILNEGEPLAQDVTHRFHVNAKPLNIGSIFEYRPRSKEEPVICEADPENPLIKIHINDREYREMQASIRNKLTIPTVINTALLTAIYKIREEKIESAEISPGWVDTIIKLAERHSIDLQESEPEKTSQILLNNPFNDLNRYQLRNREGDPE